MKKLAALAAAVVLAYAPVALAKTGDVTGHIYSTDIRAFINGAEVPSYSMDGKTAVAIEEITNEYEYDNDLRTLILYGLAPSNIVSGSSPSSKAPGQVIGNIYETDIKTYVYDRQITSYAIDGKTAVAIEDLGGDKKFSELGGRYIWDAESRTISLEFMYNSVFYDEQYKILQENNLDVEVKDGRAGFKGDPFSPGAFSFEWSDLDMYDDVMGWIRPIYTENDGEKTLLGYNFKHQRVNILHIDENTKEFMDEYVNFCYLNTDKFKAAAEAVDVPAPTRGEIIEYYEWQMSTIERFDTDDYSFLYMTQGTPHGGSQHLLLVNADGSCHDYANDFKSVSLHGTRVFDNVKIDKENEKVYLHYDVDYVIDLKTGELSEVH